MIAMMTQSDGTGGCGRRPLRNSCVLALLLLAGCGPQTSVEVTVVGPGVVDSGSATCTSTCKMAAGHLTAHANAGARFLRWSAPCGTDPVCEAVSGRVLAIFEQQQILLDLQIRGTGSVRLGQRLLPSSEKVLVDAASDVVLTAIPDRGASFSHWEGACSGSATECHLKAESPSAIAAVFEPAKLTLQVTSSGPGEVWVGGFETPCRETTCAFSVPFGSEVMLKPDPELDAMLVDSSIGCGQPDCAIRLEVDQAIWFHFENAVTIQTTGDGDGSVVWTDNLGTSGVCVPQCEIPESHLPVTMRAVAASGSRLATWSNACAANPNCTAGSPGRVSARFDAQLRWSVEGWTGNTILVSPLLANCGDVPIVANFVFPMAPLQPRYEISRLRPTVETLFEIAAPSGSTALDVLACTEDLIVVGSSFTGSTSLSNGQYFLSNGGRDALIAAYEMDGGLLWARQYSSTGDDQVRALGLRAQDVYASISFDSTPLIPTIASDGGLSLLQSLSSSGIEQWQRARSPGSSAAVVPVDGGVIWIGDFTASGGSTGCAPSTVIGTGAFVTEYGRSGNCLANSEGVTAGPSGALLYVLGAAKIESGLVLAARLFGDLNWSNVSLSSSPGATANDSSFVLIAADPSVAEHFQPARGRAIPNGSPNNCSRFDSNLGVAMTSFDGLVWLSGSAMCSLEIDSFPVSAYSQQTPSLLGFSAQTLGLARIFGPALIDSTSNGEFGAIVSTTNELVVVGRGDGQWQVGNTRLGSIGLIGATRIIGAHP